MALKTLNGLNEIGGFKIVRNEFDKMRDEYPINITDRINCISFRIQDGPIKEVGVNGCQVDTIIETAKLMLEGLNKTFTCSENDNAITCLSTAIWWLDCRKKSREARGVEGTSQQ
jgi:hypothetical protein